MLHLKEISTFIICVITISLSSQRIVNVEYPATGEISLTSTIQIPKINSGYTLWLPETENILGLIVFTHSRRDTTESDILIDYAIGNNLGVMYATTENRLEFLFESHKMDTLLGYLRSVIQQYNIPSDALLYCGMSLEGTRALKLATHESNMENGQLITPKAIVICDAPLDMVRFHKSMQRASNLNFHPAAANEGKWVSSYLEKNLGGTPEEAWEKYIHYSPYTFGHSLHKKLRSFLGIAIRAYTEPDVKWWIETRRKGYYDMNAIDLAAWINDLKLLGHENAELITTTNQGYHPDGSRHPHSWSIVNEKEMIDWFVNLLNSN